MPTITLNKTVLEKLVGKKLPLEKLKERISYLGTDLEGIEGNKIYVEIFPKRPDLLSEQGFGRAFASFIGVPGKTGFREYCIKKSGYSLKVDQKGLPKEWQYAVAAIVKGLKLDHEKVREIIQLQEKLGTTLTRYRRKGGLGLYPLEKIVFPVTFTGKKPKDICFRPLEFSKKITAVEILKQHPKGKEYHHICETWDRLPVFIDDNGTIMSMPPIINSHEVGKIDETTHNVFVEGTGPHLNTLLIAINILVTSLADMGGEIYSIEMVYPQKKITTPDLTPKKMKIHRDYINKRLGLKLGEKEIQKYLKRMGHNYNAKTQTVYYPAYRADILHEVDMIEDIAIAYGYEKVQPILPKVATTGQENSFEKYRKKIAYILAGQGYLECNTYHLTNTEDLKKMNHTSEVVELASSCSMEHGVLRNWMLPSLLQVLRSNTHHEYPQKLFDLGMVFKKDTSEETQVKEIQRLAAVSAHSLADFTEMKQTLEYLFRMLNLQYTFEDTEHPSFIPGRVARVSVIHNKTTTKVAYVGELHPIVLRNFGLEVPVVCCEVNMSEIVKMLSNER